MKILLIDNNDSFTYNLLHLTRSVCRENDSLEVVPYDSLTVDMTSGFERIVISPGPGSPFEAMKLAEVVRACERHIPILGVCLGHQAIALSYGAEAYNMARPVHGVRSRVLITGHSLLFRDIENEIMVGRYHSWCVSDTNFPACLKITAKDEDGDIMAFSHREYDVHGVQFHPESFMTKCGAKIMSNFLNYSRL